LSRVQTCSVLTATLGTEMIAGLIGTATEAHRDNATSPTELICGQGRRTMIRGLLNPNLRLYFFSFFFFKTGVQTQGLTPAQQALYHLSHTPRLQN
jgi:hypothetical protein